MGLGIRDWIPQIRTPHSALRNPQSSIRNSHSALGNPNHTSANRRITQQSPDPPIAQSPNGQGAAGVVHKNGRRDPQRPFECDLRFAAPRDYQLNFTPNFAIRGFSTVVAFSNAAPDRQLMFTAVFEFSRL
jgi:hypothetical protein